MIPANLTSFAVESGIAMAKEEHIVCFLFNPNLNHVWLTRRDTSSHTHRMDGIYREVQPDETLKQAVLRAIEDNLLISDVTDLRWVAAQSLPFIEKPSGDAGKEIHIERTMHYFAAIIPNADAMPDTIATNRNRSIVRHETEYITNRTPYDRYLADGVPYFMHLAVTSLVEHKKKS